MIITGRAWYLTEDSLSFDILANSMRFWGTLKRLTWLRRRVLANKVMLDDASLRLLGSRQARD